MKNSLSKILLFIVGIFYLIAALEIEVFDCKQTWGDECDTYTISVKGHDNAAKVIKANSFINCGFHFVFSFVSPSPIRLHEDVRQSTRPPCALYLWNCVFRI